MSDPKARAALSSCICVTLDGQPYGYSANGDGTYEWRIDPACEYHQAAAAEPWNHRIPWNCPTYWDGCNCEGGPFYDKP